MVQVFFELYGISNNCDKLQLRIAEYLVCLKFIRTFLCELPFNLSADSTSTFTVHNYRHVYNTAMRQLNIRSDNLEDAGHWKRGPAMALTCDSEDCAGVVNDGMRLCCCRWWLERGWCNMLAATCTNDATCNFCNAEDSLCSTKSRCDDIWNLRVTKVTVYLTECRSSCPSSVWVINMDSQVSHTWRQWSGKPRCYTVCTKWKRTPPQTDQARVLPKLSYSQSCAC